MLIQFFAVCRGITAARHKMLVPTPQLECYDACNMFHFIALCTVSSTAKKVGRLFVQRKLMEKHA